MILLKMTTVDVFARILRKKNYIYSSFGSSSPWYVIPAKPQGNIPGSHFSTVPMCDVFIVTGFFISWWVIVSFSSLPWQLVDEFLKYFLEVQSATCSLVANKIWRLRKLRPLHFLMTLNVGILKFQTCYSQYHVDLRVQLTYWKEINWARNSRYPSADWCGIETANWYGTEKDRLSIVSVQLSFIFPMYTSLCLGVVMVSPIHLIGKSKTSVSLFLPWSTQIQKIGSRACANLKPLE